MLDTLELMAGAMGNAVEANHWTDLIDQARSGDDHAMDLLLVQLRNYLLFVVNAELSDALQSKFGGSDVVQQSMLEAYQSIDQFRGASKLELMAWMKKIAINNLQGSEADEELVSALRKLPDRQREVIEARHKQGQSYRQIAKQMQVSENAVRKLWSRGIQNLKCAVGEL